VQPSSKVSLKYCEAMLLPNLCIYSNCFINLISDVHPRIYVLHTLT
jgi:hypothetical protein